ncbi:MAG: DUF1579 domain-containing protein [Ignavibacteriaceae bacterium]|jgi:hypothetical protein|nr:DUF1579 domain-containing protein [Ignavibacteriaceae bacterium]MCW8996156.1 DUF1579 domain-containing protein [Psychromonas sp.]MCW9094749.1 DUF1579 domain-containing protein [Ignavibacteriaceae bacterium]
MYKFTNSLFVILLLLSPYKFLIAQQEDTQAEQMKIWTAYMTPGPMHEMMAKSVGDWKTINRYWMDPSGDPMVTEGTAKTEMIMGGRYQTTKTSGTVMGMPMEGMSLIGYDNATGEFTEIWIDNLGTGTSVAKGTYDENTNSINMDGTMVDPMTKSEMKFKQVTKFLDDNHQIIEMYMDNNGQEVKSMEIEFIR